MKHKIYDNQSGFFYVEILLGVVLLLAVGFTVWRISSVNSSVNSSIKNTEEVSKQTPIYNSSNKIEEATEQDESAQQPEETKQDTNEAPQPTTSQSSNTVTEPEKKVEAKTDCIPEDASEYAKSYLSYSNSQFLAGKFYADATKFYDALKFAGLGSVIDNDKVVVLAPNNYVWDQKLSDAEEAYVNQSPTNMKELVGWHVISSCFIYSGNAQNISGTATVNTLNGPVTFDGSGLGAFNGAQVAIWDWFTSNGAVTFMKDFINKPTVP